MKKTGYTLFLLAVLLLSSCIVESIGTTDEVVLENGVISITVKDQQNGTAEDEIKTIRFVVFKDIATSPGVEVNDFWDEAKIAAANPQANGVWQVTALLQVTRKTSGPNMKRVFAIVNEPSQMTTALNGVTTYNDLEKLQLDFAHFLNSNHTGLLPTGKGLPMTGMIDTNKVYEEITDAENDPAEMELERAVARVEVYLRKETGVTIDLTTTSKIKLENTYDKEYFFYHTIGGDAFGRIQTVALSDLFTKTWNPAGNISDNEILTHEDGSLLCSFYTPERTCTAANDDDKLVLRLELVCGDGSVREGELILNTASREGAATAIPITEIRRNNSYQVLVTAGNNALVTIKVQLIPWKRREVSGVFNE